MLSTFRRLHLSYLRCFSLYKDVLHTLSAFSLQSFHCHLPSSSLLSFYFQLFIIILFQGSIKMSKEPHMHTDAFLARQTLALWYWPNHFPPQPFLFFIFSLSCDGELLCRCLFSREYRYPFAGPFPTPTPTPPAPEFWNPLLRAHLRMGMWLQPGQLGIALFQPQEPRTNTLLLEPPRRWLSSRSGTSLCFGFPRRLLSGAPTSKPDHRHSDPALSLLCNFGLVLNLPQFSYLCHSCGNCKCQYLPKGRVVA